MRSDLCSTRYGHQSGRYRLSRRARQCPCDEYPVTGVLEQTAVTRDFTSELLRPSAIAAQTDTNVTAAINHHRVSWRRCVIAYRCWRFLWAVIFCVIIKVHVTWKKVATRSTVGSLPGQRWQRGPGSESTVDITIYHYISKELQYAH